MNSPSISFASVSVSGPAHHQTSGFEKSLGPSSSSSRILTPYNPRPGNPSLIEKPKIYFRQKYLEKFQAQHERGLRALEAYAATAGGSGTRAGHIIRESEDSTENYDLTAEEKHAEHHDSEDDSEDEDEEMSGERREAAIWEQQEAHAALDKSPKLPKFFPARPPPISSLKPLDRPVVIPQVLATMLHSPFQLAYADELADAGVSKEDFKAFIKTLNAAVAQSPVFQVIGITSQMVGFVSSWEAQLVSAVGWAVSEIGSIIQSKARADAFLEHANAVFFKPRGLICTVVTTKIRDELFGNGTAATTDVEVVQLPAYEDIWGYEEPLPYDAQVHHGQFGYYQDHTGPPSFHDTHGSRGLSPVPSGVQTPPTGTGEYATLTPLKPDEEHPNAVKRALNWSIKKHNRMQIAMAERADKKLDKKAEKVLAKAQRKAEREHRRGRDYKADREIRKGEKKLKRIQKKKEGRRKTGGPFWLVVLNDPDAARGM